MAFSWLLWWRYHSCHCCRDRWNQGGSLYFSPSWHHNSSGKRSMGQNNPLAWHNLTTSCHCRWLLRTWAWKTSKDEESTWRKSSWIVAINPFQSYLSNPLEPFKGYNSPSDNLRMTKRDFSAENAEAEPVKIFRLIDVPFTLNDPFAGLLNGNDLSLESCRIIQATKFLLHDQPRPSSRQQSHIHSCPPQRKSYHSIWLYLQSGLPPKSCAFMQLCGQWPSRGSHPNVFRAIWLQSCSLSHPIWGLIWLLSCICWY